MVIVSLVLVAVDELAQVSGFLPTEVVVSGELDVIAGMLPV